MKKADLKKAMHFPVPGPNELRPNETRADASRGALSHVPFGIETVHDYGAAPMPWGALYANVERPTSSATSSARVGTEDAEIGPGKPQPTKSKTK